MYKKVKIGVVLPTRGDRPGFLDNAKRLLGLQTVQPDVLEIVDDPPVGDGVDISWRYRTGCARAFNQKCDVVLFWEDDDWYSPVYIQAMIDGWLMFKKPAIFGGRTTLYYHIKRQMWLTMNHPGRASAMNTLITPKVLDIVWCRDDDPYVDIHLWKKLQGAAVEFERLIVVGIKHGIGLCGGSGHTGNKMPYIFPDTDYQYLLTIVDKESVAFYKEIIKK